jgi:o-succinylbenzoate synthase
MSLKGEFFKKTFYFNFKARTSRGLMKQHEAWFVKIWHSDRPEIFGIGECGPLPGLSIDRRDEIERVLQNCLAEVSKIEQPDLSALDGVVPENFPAVMFAFETAFLDLKNGGKRIIYDNAFLKGHPIPINGLIWMGDMDFTMSQINIKMYDGFKCIKLKVGGLDFDRECDVLNYIRKRYFRDNIIIRLDANGAFKIDDVLYRLTELAKFNIHSIEQPIKPGLPEMEELCRKSPIPVAFDEELIGVLKREKKIALLDRLNPQFIILKPTLHGGLRHCQEWIKLAEERGIGWWITSALESNIGLNAICQFTANYDINLPQGLGTGSIYTENFSSPLTVEKGQIFIDSTQLWNEDEMRAEISEIPE